MFEFIGTAAYQLKQQARCIVALEGETDHNKFVLSTLELKGENELHVIDFNEDTNEVSCTHVFSHPHEVWACASCPAPEHADLCFTTFSTGNEMHTALWRLPGVMDAGAATGAASGGAPTAEPLHELLRLGEPTALGKSRGVMWNAVLPEQVGELKATRLTIYQLGLSQAACSAIPAGSCGAMVEGAEFACGRWDPHHAHSIGVGCGETLATVDTRTMRTAHTISNAHQQRVRGLDYNPNKPYVVLSCGDDYAIKIWDLRKGDEPLFQQRAHAHWVTNACFNRFHDQLVLSAGTDCAVKLWRASAASSAPNYADPEDAEFGAGEEDEDGLVKTFDEHEQSVFGVAWSAADAWIFASLSLDGKVVINHVPPAEKYKILL